MAKTKKLTPSQTTALSRLVEGSADFYDLSRAGASGPTSAWLCKHGLAVEQRGESAERIWAITDAGRKALAAGRVTFNL